jgi:hypothetical protein
MHIHGVHLPVQLPIARGNKMAHWSPFSLDASCVVSDQLEQFSSIDACQDIFQRDV